MESTHVFWESTAPKALEHLAIRRDLDIRADGVIIRANPETRPRIRYVVTCDADWNMESLEVHPHDGAQPLRWRVDRSGTWYDNRDREIPELNGCRDAMLSASAFTASIPVLRLKVDEGEVREIRVVHLDVDSFDVRPTWVRLTGVGQKQVHVEDLGAGLKTMIVLADDGLAAQVGASSRRLELTG